MERALLSVLDWWDVSGLDVPKIKPAPTKRRVPSRKTSHPLQRDQARAPSNPKASITARPVGKAEAPLAPIEPKLSFDLAKKAKTLAELQAAIKGFNAGALSDNARQMVFARGNPNADVMLIGEAPGGDEDRAGKPFVGPSGQLLDKIFASIGLSEDELYITNVINWRVPGNRNANPDEIALCLPFIRRHIELAQPKAIVLVGGVSMSALTDFKGITKSRGQWANITAGEHSAPALVLYHPAYVLRQPHLKRDVWRDILALDAKIKSL